MKFCPDCGNNIEGVKFCPECGYKVGGATPIVEKSDSAASLSTLEKVNTEKTILEFSTFLFGMEDKKASVAKGIDLSLPRENYTLTNQRIIIEKQKVMTSRREIELLDISKIDVKQGIKEKIMGVGDIEIELNDREIVTFRRIKNPFDIKDTIRKEVQNSKLKSNTDFRMNL